MDAEAVLCASVRADKDDSLRFRPVSDWERRAAELATRLRKSNRDLWETTEILAEAVGQNGYACPLLCDNLFD